MVFAHADDELIFGWPVLLNDNYEKELIICAGDKYNYARNWSRRKDILRAVCDELSVPLTCLDYNSGFYAAHVKRPKWKAALHKLTGLRLFASYFEMCKDILSVIESKTFDCLFTHNFWGEYGNPDHLLINALIFNNVNAPLLTGDARISRRGMPLSAAAAPHPALTAACASEHTLDIPRYESLAALYKKAGLWTWAQPPLRKISLYLHNGRAATGQHTAVS
jgi:LmbE family N-acetylglucosaminyl deacetylase